LVTDALFLPTREVLRRFATVRSALRTADLLKVPLLLRERTVRRTLRRATERTVARLADARFRRAVFFFAVFFAVRFFAAFFFLGLATM
jgi:hypothetical protein